MATDGFRPIHQSSKGVEDTQGGGPDYPVIADPGFNVAKLCGMVPAATPGDAKTRTPAGNQAVRNVFVIGPDKKIKPTLAFR